MDVIILAAGKGERMKSKEPKVIMKLGGKPMLMHLLETITDLNPNKVYIVYNSEEIKRLFNLSDKFVFIKQERQLGTADAVKSVKPLLKDADGTILVLYGDMPLLRSETLKKMEALHRSSGADLTILTAEVNNPFGYGRIKRENGRVIGIIEERNATPQEKEIREINVGVYFFKSSCLWENIDRINLNELKGEYYLTDIVEILAKSKKKISAMKIAESPEVLNINTKEDLLKAEKYLGSYAK